MSDRIGGLEAVSRMLAEASTSGAPGGGASFEAVLDAVPRRGQGPGGPPESSVALPWASKPDGVPGIPDIAGRLDDARRRLDASIRSVERSPSAAALAKLAVVQSDYTLAAQVAVRGIQKTAQSLSELTRLQ